MSEAHIILTRDLRQQPADPTIPPTGFSVVRVRRADDRAFTSLNKLYTAHGFRDGWAAGMLDSGAEALKIITAPDEGGSPITVAAGWLTRNPFWIEEIQQTYCPSPEGVYLFGDFVMPAYRGRRFQQLVVHERVRLCIACGWHWAHTMTHEQNVPSLRNYQAEGFVVAGKLGTVFLAGWRFDTFRRTRLAVPFGSLSHEGLRLPFSVRLRKLA